MHCEGRAGIWATWSRAGIFGSHLIRHGDMESHSDGIGGDNSNVVQLEGLQQSFLTADPFPVPICKMGLAGELRSLVCDSTRGADAEELCHQDVTSLCLLRAPTKAFVVR